VIALRAKNIEFDVTYIDLQAKPDWFLAISPHGKVPVLKVDDIVLFESNAIAEYLDETVAPRLHPDDPFQRARHRAWTDFIPDFASMLNTINYAPTKEALEKAVAAAPQKIARIELALKDYKEPGGPYFGGSKICLVDAAYAPFFQRFMIVEDILKTGIFDQFPLVRAWAKTLLDTPLITGAVADVFEAEYYKAMERRNGWTWHMKLAQQRTHGTDVAAQ
jgi:glutathione S-transferase